MEVVTERLLHAERKQKEKSSPDSSGEKAMMTKRQFRGRGPQCHYCKKYGHIQKNCTKRIKAEEEKAKQGGSDTVGGKSPKTKKVGLITQHVLGVREPAHDWIVDSGATCLICNSKELFEDFNPLSEPQKVALGDGHILEVIGTGTVELKLVGSRKSED